MLPILYSFRRCPYAMRARYTLAVLDMPVLLREVVLKSKPSALLELGGRSSVPQLIDSNGTRYPESLDIIFWALSQTANTALHGQLWPKSCIKRHKINTWITYNDKTFKHWLDRYKYSNRYSEYPEEYYREKGEVFLRRLNNRLNQCSYLLGDEMSIVDIALFPFIRQFAAVDSGWFEASGYCKLKIWLDRFVRSEVFEKQVMEKFSAWEAESEDVVFPRKSLK